MSGSLVGVILIARNGDRLRYYQNPNTYAGSITETTALGEVQSHQLGGLLRNTYLDSSSSSFVDGISRELVDNKQLKVLIKAGAEGSVVFDSAIALLQGLYPPTPKNKIVLANETTVVAPLGGYQYVHVETVEPVNDRSLESWTDCPAFQKHISEFYASDEFKQKEEEAQPFFKNIKDFVFGRATTLNNIIHDFIASQLMHNQTFAFRLPPTFAEQAHALANWHENGVFSDPEVSGIGNIAGRSLLHTILSSLQRIAFNDDPLKFLLVETTYQPFISFFHEVGMVKQDPTLAAIPDYASALAIELRRGSPPDLRDFLRFKFKNGTNEDFKTLHAFGHNGDIALTEFIYRTEVSQDISFGKITANEQCRARPFVATNSGPMFVIRKRVVISGGSSSTQLAFMAFFSFIAVFFVIRFMKRSRTSKLRLYDEEQVSEKSKRLVSA
ncbi:histidine phosphatase superfamily [Mycena floridula]|nr:histidine phosphatase superfamily [Mycena floridula]